MPAPYCTNVHPAPTLDAALAALDEHATGVRAALAADVLPLGWWLPAPAVGEAINQTERIHEFLGERGLAVVTFNAFPHGNFHQPVVKQAVYDPTWADEERANYTRNVARLLAALLPEGASASVSTVPIGWRAAAPDLAVAGAQLRTLADDLAALEAETGRRIHVDLEPEPGCVFDRAQHVVDFFDAHLLPGAAEDRVRRHIGVCHDVCHAAVMFEPQADAIGTYRRAGISIGKVQVSSALKVVFDGTSDDAARRAALAAFAEDRYLHQTSVRRETGAVMFHEDLPAALEEGACGEWRIHFHVPINRAALGPLGSTQDDVAACLAALGGERPMCEVETYAWNVLPVEHQPATLAEGIAGELRWFAGLADQPGAV